ncbi:unnamed protein product [Fraxinus pennsylvanica]|uniref:Uncharacterized protein n=1 Tax=Fraxinus pennsylvanica TaxID=56036 RepID=A0AAD2EBV1_9LAMI|nr:unnamed protein product [Fraxinus pennsylvanica]
MAGNQEKLRAFRLILTVVSSFLLASIFVSAEGSSLKQKFLAHNANGFSHSDLEVLTNYQNFTRQANKSGYQHVWPDFVLRFLCRLLSPGGLSVGSMEALTSVVNCMPLCELLIGDIHMTRKE